MAQVSPDLIYNLKLDEGLRLQAYPDPLSGGDPWTIGYGHTGPEVRKGLVWTEKQCSDALFQDASKHNEELLKALPWVATLDPVRRDVLYNMAFNLGVKGLLGFKRTLDLVKQGHYKRASEGMLRSLWAKQVKGRATRLAKEMEQGKYVRSKANPKLA